MYCRVTSLFLLRSGRGRPVVEPRLELVLLAVRLESEVAGEDALVLDHPLALGLELGAVLRPLLGRVAPANKKMTSRT